MVKHVPKVFALCAVAAGYDLIRALHDRGVELSGIIALSDNGNRTAVSGFVKASQAAVPRPVPVYEVGTYGLSSAADLATIKTLSIDILIVAGWQRLIPGWLIDQCGEGVIGLHGSSRGISEGRGRSPQNWALIMGADSFEIAAFLISPGVDDGPVLATGKFDYTPYDDIASSYQKSMLLGAEMIATLVNDWERGLANARPQNSADAWYLPQRQPEDGALDWFLPADTIRRHVAALSSPYPGAFTTLDGKELIVWRARPIGKVSIALENEPGQILQIAGDGAFLVATGDGLMMVDEYSFEGSMDELVAGKVLTSRPFQDTISAIVARHESKCPDQPLSPDVTALSKGVL